MSMNMKNKISAALALMAGVGVAGSVLAADDTQPLTVTANNILIVEIAITNSTPLAFDAIELNLAGGTADSSVSGVYTITGTVDDVYFVTAETATLSYTGIDPTDGPETDTMDVVLTATSSNDFVLATGTDELEVSGSITYSAGQLDGDYTGDVIVTVEYL
jgi:hypothetical protein